jgi:hypothetical protein
MRKLSSTLCAALALTFAAGTAVPTSAAPVFVPTAPAVSSDVVKVQDRYERRWDRRDRSERRDRGEWRDRDDRRGRFERRGNFAYYNNHRGYRYHRPGYRQHNGYWFPPAAFIMGAIISGALSNQQPVVRMSAQHVRWCQNRWRSYRVSDNSYQPFNGPRRACVSPYG